MLEAADWFGMNQAPFQVFDMDDGYAIVELSERATAPAPALELHVLRDELEDETLAYWLLDDGRLLHAAGVGDA